LKVEPVSVPVVPDKRAQRTRSGTHTRRRILLRTVFDGFLQQQMTGVMGPGVRQAFAGTTKNHTGSAAEYFTWLNAKLDSIEAIPSSRVSLFFKNAS
jgi:hypothetical protein